MCKISININKTVITTDSFMSGDNNSIGCQSVSESTSAGKKHKKGALSGLLSKIGKLIAKLIYFIIAIASMM